MNEAELLELAQEAILLTIKIATPVMLVGLVVGVLVALVQALTQIQEITLVFVPKIVAIFLSIFLLLPAMMLLLTAFMEMLADKMIAMGM